jgi:hypothetical protein
METANKIIQKWLNIDNPDAILDLSYLGLEELPPIVSTCRKLQCSHNKLTYLPDLPNCQRLDCSHNNLTTLPDLPKCQYLRCGHNSLKSLPDISNCTYIYCSFNLLTTIQHLPKCQRLVCQNNNLFFLPDLPLCNGIYAQRNKYLYLTKKQTLKIFPYRTRPNYYRCARIIQRTYKKYLHRKYKALLIKYLYGGPCNIVCLYIA